MSVSERGWTALAFLLLIGAMGLAAWYVVPGPNWLVAMALLIAAIVLLGKVCTGRGLGILISERKLMSLSRFQMILWTVLIVSAYLVIAIERVKSADIVNPLVIGVDWQVWALLGMSTTSLIGAPLLNGNKTRKEVGRDSADKQAVLKKTADAFGEKNSDVDSNRSGVLYGNSSINDARFTDLFEGDELVDTQFLDVGKLQLFLFTAIVAMTYGVQLFQLIAYNDLTDEVSLPKINEGLLALLGASHAGYLGTKAMTRTPTSA